MNKEEKQLLASHLHQIIVEVLGGPRGDPDESHIEAARMCHDIVNEFDLGAEMTEIDGDYEEDKTNFFESNYDSDEEVEEE